MNKKLYRSETDRRLLGVCGGLGEYIGVDPTIIRLLWVFAILMGGSGILAYFVYAFIVPTQSRV